MSAVVCDSVWVYVSVCKPEREIIVCMHFNVVLHILLCLHWMVSAERVSEIFRERESTAAHQRPWLVTIATSFTKNTRPSNLHKMPPTGTQLGCNR